MDEVQKLQIAERLRDLQENSPLKQPRVAERLGMTLRGYQHILKRGTTLRERVEELADIFGADANWIWSGNATPIDRLAQLEQKVDQVLVELKAQEAKRKSDAARREVQRQAQPQTQKPPQRKEETGS